MKLLEIKNLSIQYRTSKGNVQAVKDVSFDIEKGEAIGLVGESGCGKTTIAMSLMGLLPSNAEVTEGQILFKGEDLLKKTEEEMQKIRWKGISMIFQAAMNALNPVMRIDDQIIEAIKTHNPSIDQEALHKWVEALFKLVGIDPQRAHDYPHEYSGGMKQRAIIAMALACNPDLIIADEPTTALDVLVQDQIISEIIKLQERLDMTMIYISHDISVIIETCSMIGVLYAGTLVEYAPTEELVSNPLHPYTIGLFSSYPSITGEIKKLNPIPGEPPDLINPPSGCRFHPRNPGKEKICEEKEPKLRPVGNRHYVACHLVEVGKTDDK